MILSPKTLMEEAASRQEDLNGPFFEFGCIGFDAWFDSDGVAEAENGCERFSGGLSVIWSVDACSMSRELRSQFAVHAESMVRRTAEGLFPCYMPEADHPGRTTPLSEELWEVHLLSS